MISKHQNSLAAFAAKFSRLPLFIKTIFLILFSLAGSHLARLSAAGSAPFDLFWGFVMLAVVPSVIIVQINKVRIFYLFPILTISWCTYLAVGSGATYI